MTEKRQYTEAQIVELLRSRYASLAFAFLTQVPNGTGDCCNRICDAMVMSLWPSKGFTLQGFEIKVNRSDWLSELQQPDKAAAFFIHCHYWWIVCPRGIAKPEECPAEWGIIEVTNAGNLRIKKAASLREPQAVDWPFLAGLLRAASRNASSAELRAARQSGYKTGVAMGHKSERASKEWERSRAERELKSLQTSLDAFEASSGLTITDYGGGELGEMVAKARKVTEIEQRISELKGTAEYILQLLAEEPDHA